MNYLHEILRAEQRIRPFLRETPLDYSYSLSNESGCRVYLKLENLQYTGSFKVRGALNKLLSLTAAERKKGVVIASTGNHAAATAWGLQKINIAGKIFVPKNTASTKVQTIRDLGAEVTFHDSDEAVETERHARQFAKNCGMIYISPYNDAQVIGGQGTVGLELSRQLNKIAAVFMALGGGGLISGVASYLKGVQREVEIIGCSPENSPVMIESVKAGKILDFPSKPTLSDGTAGGVEKGAITFTLCQDLVDDYVTVSEGEIREAMRRIIESQHLLIEGAAGVAIASFLKRKAQFKRKNVVIIICGGNISLETLKSIL